MSVRTLPSTGLPVGGVSPSVLVCGDPARAELIAASFDEPRLLSNQREYTSYSGSYRGVPMTVCSHGIGAPGAAIAFEELIAAGAQRIIRVGTCGGIQPDIVAGGLVIAAAAVQRTGYGREVVPEGYPAVADPAITLALEARAAASGLPFRRGLVVSRDGFYGGVSTHHTPDYRQLSQANVLAVEMECAALFIVGGLRRIPTGAIVAVDGNVLAAAESIDTYEPGRPIVKDAVDAAIAIAIDALHTLS